MSRKKVELSEAEKRTINMNYLINDGFVSNDIIAKCFYGLLFQVIENFKSTNESSEIIIPYLGKLHLIYEGAEANQELRCIFIPTDNLKDSFNDVVNGEPSIIDKSLCNDIQHLFNKIATKG